MLTDYTVKYLGTHAQPLPVDDPDVWTHILNDSPEGAVIFVNADSESIPGDACFNENDYEIYEVTSQDSYSTVQINGSGMVLVLNEDEHGA